MKAIYRREIATYEHPHLVRRGRREFMATHFILSIVSVDNGNTWWYLGETTDYPCASFTHARDMLDHFVGEDNDPEVEYVMNPIIWEMLSKEKVEV